MKLSVVVPSFNRSKSLMRLLESLSSQSAPASDWECVVVDNNCTDSTQKDFADMVASRSISNFRIICCAEQGLSAARNAGIDASTGDYIAFVDDDETVNEDFVKAYIDFFSDRGAFVAGGKVVAVYETARPSWMSKYLERMIANPVSFPSGTRRFPKDRVPAGGNMAFSRYTFTLHGMFRTELGRNGGKLLGGEENDMFRRIRNLGESLYYVPNAVIYHHIPESRLTGEYVDRLSFGVGQSKRLRTESRRELRALYDEESRKQIATRLLAFWYMATFRFGKASWLLRMRRGIVKGVHTAI